MPSTRSSKRPKSRQPAIPPPPAPAPPSFNFGWIVTLAGLGINLALGVLYAWSVISARLSAAPDKGGWGWSEQTAGAPYAIALLVFAITTIFAGRWQDRYGPRVVAAIGGLLCGAGLIIAGLTKEPLWVTLGFGVLAGIGIGFGYASATPPAVKWFPPKMTGLIAGLVVAGFGLASAYISPLASYLVKAYGIQDTFIFLGGAFMVIVFLFAQVLRDPPAGYVCEAAPSSGAKASAAAAPAKCDYEWHEMLRTPQFYLLWVMYLFGGGAGLMVIGKAAKFIPKLAEIPAADAVALGALCVTILAVGNALGRVIAGALSDRIGRIWTLFIIFVFQAALLFSLSFFSDFTVLLVVGALMGANYGANLAVFPAITKDYFGLKNFGVNYGFVFSAWGVGGFLGTYLISYIYDHSAVLPADRSFNGAFPIAAICLLVAAVLTFLVKAPKPKAVE